MLSVLANDNPRLAVLIVGHESPMEHLPTDDRIHFLDCGFTPPAAGVARTPTVIINDKMCKLRRGWEHASELLPSQFVMSLDADDFVSRRLVGFLAAAQAPAYRISQGWIWNTGSRSLIEQSNDFDKICGSSVIFRSDVAGLDFNVNKFGSFVPEHILEIADKIKFTLLVNEMHGMSSDGLAEHGLAIECVPFRAAIYRIGNPNSYMQRRAVFHSLRFFFGRLRRTRLLTNPLRQEFSIEFATNSCSRSDVEQGTEARKVSMQQFANDTSWDRERVLTFVIPLMPKVNDEQWKDRCSKFRHTIASILNSANPDFEIVVAGHCEPAGLPLDKRLHFLQVDFAPPQEDADAASRRRDKLWKIRCAWDYAKRNWKSRYVMGVDADDLISNRLVEWLAANGNELGYRVAKGWIIKDSWENWLKKEDAFYLSCGSSVIVSARHADLEVKPAPEQKVLEGLFVGDDSAKDIRHMRTLLVTNRHGRCAENFEAFGLAVRDLPLRAVIYRLGSPFSLSMDKHKISSMKMLFSSIKRMRPITAALRKEFAL